MANLAISPVDLATDEASNTVNIRGIIAAAAPRPTVRMRRGRSDGERWFTPRAKGEDDVDEGGVSPTRRSPSPLALARPPRRRATGDAPITADDPTPPVSAVGAAAPSCPSASARGSGGARRPSNDASNKDDVDLDRLQARALARGSRPWRAVVGGH